MVLALRVTPASPAAKLGVLTMANSHQDVGPGRADGDGQVGAWVALPLEPVLVRVGAGVAEPVPRNWLFGTRLAGENRPAPRPA